MATKPDDADVVVAHLGPHASPDYDLFERFLPSLQGDRFYLQSSQQDFIDLLSHNDNTIKKSDPADLIEIGKRALGKGELQIAEKFFVKAIRTSILDNSSTKSPEPYFYLAEILEKKAEDKELLLKQRYLLQAAALYNFVRNYLESRDTDVELSTKLSKLVSRKLLDIQDNMITLCGGNHCQSRFDAERKKNELKELRNEVKESLESLKSISSSSNQGKLTEYEARQKFKDQTAVVKKLSGAVSDRMKKFFASIIDECLALLGTPSCDYEVIVFGSLARNETTPYSDFEWAILKSSEEEECKVFFRNLTNLVHLQVINLGETILPSMNIEAIEGEWFYDDVTPRGVSFDGLLPQACKIPLGNMKHFELIHTPEKMAAFQSDDWYEKSWSLADTLMTFSPLRSEKSVLVEAYRKEMDKILSCPCDSESCQHDALSDAWPTRGSCRGLRVLHKDLSLYGDMMVGNNGLDEGKFYDVKKEIYRLPDRVIAALAKCCEVKSTGIFAVLDELHEKEIISSEARDNLASASAIAIRLRLSTYSKTGKQAEQLRSNANDKTGGKAVVYHMPTDEELFHFFFVAIPLYDELRQFKTFGNIPCSFASCSFFNDSDITTGHIYCRLSKYDKAIECYERAARHNPDNLSTEIRRIRLAICANHNTQESDKIRENLNNLLRKIVKNFSPLDTNANETTLELTPLMDRVGMEECRQLMEGLHFAGEIYGSPIYFAVSEKILDLFEILFASNKSMSKELNMLELASLKGSVDQENEIDAVVSRVTPFIDKEGVSTRSIALLNSLGEFLFRQGKLDKAYRCLQRAMSMAHLLYGTTPNVNMVTSLKFLSAITITREMNEESKIYCKSLVQLCESFGGIKFKLLIKETYLNLSEINCTADESLRYVENGLKVTTGTKNERESFLNCMLSCRLAIKLHSKQSPELAWEAILHAQACWKDCIDTNHTERKEQMISAVVKTLCEMKKSREGIELLKEELKLTLKSQAQEKTLCLKALGELCLEQGLALDASKYYSQAMDNLLNFSEDVFHDLDCRIGILKAVVMENSASKEKPVLIKALFISAMKLPTSYKKCSFLQEFGEFCHSIGEISDARLCSLEALRSAMELPASDGKLVFLIHIGELCESISDIALARQCYDEALNSYKEESNISRRPPLMEIYLEIKLCQLTKKIIGVDFPPKIHYDRAAAILRQHVATGRVDSTTVLTFHALAQAYRSKDKNEEIQLLLESLKVSEIIYGEDKSHEMVATTLQELSDTYYMSGDKEASMKYRERQIKMELELYPENPFLERIVNTLMKWTLSSFEVPSGNNSIEHVCDCFLSSLNDKGFLLNTITAKTIAAWCFTFIAVLFYTSNNFEKAKSLNEKASQLFGEVQENVEIERDPCRETCDLMRTIFSSEIILPSHRTELFIYLFNTGCPLYPESVSAEDKRCKHFGDEAQARSLLAEEQNTLSSLPIVQSQIDTLERYKSKGAFRLAAEIHTSLQPRLSIIYEDSHFDTREKLMNSAIEANDKNRPSNALRFLDLALQLPEGQCGRTPKILKLRGECFLSLGHFRSAAIDFAKADSLYSTKTIDNREELCEYSEVLIGLIKSEILCNNVEAAWLVCKRGIKLVSDHELKETIDLQAAKLLYLGLKCIEQLEFGEDEENKLGQAYYLYKEALSLCDSTKEVGDSFVKEKLGVVKTIFEVKFLLKNIFPTLRLKDEDDNTFQETKAEFLDCVDAICDIRVRLRSDADFMGNVSARKICNVEPKNLMNVGINCSLKARLLIMFGDVEQCINWLYLSLATFFSAPLPDFMWYFEEFLPLLQAIIANKSKAPDQSRSPFEQAVDMCKETLIEQYEGLKHVNQFLTNLITIYRSLGRAQEAMVVAEIGLEMTDFMCNNSDSDKLNNRCRMLLHLAQIHQQNLSNPAFNKDEELNRAESYYLIKRGRQNYLSNRGQKEDMVLGKDLSYANFLCERRRFAEAISMLEDMTSLDKLLWNKYVYVEYFSCAFYGAGVEKSVKMDGELLTTVGDVSYNLLVRAYVGMGKKKEAVAACEILTDVNLLDVHEASFGKRPSCKPYLVEDCHRELLSLLREEDRHQFRNCDFPLSSSNLAKLYYLLGEYEMAVEYIPEHVESFPEDVESLEMLEIIISCLHLAGNELVASNRGNESLPLFQQLFEMLQVKDGFLDKPLHDQWEILQTYSFANQYYLFRSLGRAHFEKENTDAAIQCYERCVQFDEDFIYDQDIVAILSELYQTKALTVDLDNEDSRKVYMDLAWELFQKLFQKTAELTTFVELSFALLLTRFGRYEEAVGHFYKVIERADDKSLVTYGNMDKPLLDVYLCREIEALGGSVVIPDNVLSAYELISTLMKLNRKGKAQKVASFLESVVQNYPLEIDDDLITHSMAGYAYKIIGNKEKAAEIFISVLEKNPAHPPVTEALESLCM